MSAGAAVVELAARRDEREARGLQTRLATVAARVGVLRDVERAVDGAFCAGASLRLDKILGLLERVERLEVLAAQLLRDAHVLAARARARTRTE